MARALLGLLVLSAPLLTLGCAQLKYAQYVRFEDPEGATSPFEGCRTRFTSPRELRAECPGVEVQVSDKLRDTPYDVLRRWPEEERARQQAALSGMDAAPVRVEVERVALPGDETWPLLRAITMAGEDGLIPVQDVWLVRAPFDRDGVREVRCTATGPLGAERCAKVVPALLAATPPAALPAKDVLFAGCERERFPLHKVRGATRALCTHLRLVEHDRASDLPEPRDLARVFGLATGATEGETTSLPDPPERWPNIDARAFTLTNGGRVMWSGVIARDRDKKRYVHCGMELPPALAQRHCYRAVLLELVGDDGLRVTPGG